MVAGCQGPPRTVRTPRAFTDAKGTKYRLNVSHIASHAGDATDGGCEANIRMLNGINIDVRESVEAIDRLIGNTDGGSILSQ